MIPESPRADASVAFDAPKGRVGFAFVRRDVVHGVAVVEGASNGLIVSAMRALVSASTPYPVAGSLRYGGGGTHFERNGWTSPASS